MWRSAVNRVLLIVSGQRCTLINHSHDHCEHPLHIYMHAGHAAACWKSLYWWADMFSCSFDVAELTSGFPPRCHSPRGIYAAIRQLVFALAATMWHKKMLLLLLLLLLPLQGGLISPPQWLTASEWKFMSECFSAWEPSWTSEVFQGFGIMLDGSPNMHPEDSVGASSLNWRQHKGKLRCWKMRIMETWRGKFEGGNKKKIPQVAFEGTFGKTMQWKDVF